MPQASVGGEDSLTGGVQPTTGDGLAYGDGVRPATRAAAVATTVPVAAAGPVVTTGPDPARAPAIVDVTRLRVAIARLSRRLRKHELAGLTPTQLAALSTVERSGPLRLGDLAAAERVAPSTLTRLVSALEDQGYVERRAVPGDARVWELVATARGHEILDRIRQESTVLLADSLRTLSPDQLGALAAALPALEQLADAAPH